MSEETLKYQAKRIEELTGESMRRKTALRDAMKESAALKERLAEMEKTGGDKAVEKANARIKELEAAVEAADQAVRDAPSRHAEEVKKLKADLLARDRRATYDKKAAGKVRSDAMAMDDAFERIQWGDDEHIDESKVEAEIDRIITERSYLKQGPDGPESAAGGNGKSSLTPRPPGPGSDRGAAPGKAAEITSPTGDAFRIA